MEKNISPYRKKFVSLQTQNGMEYGHIETDKLV